MAECFLLGWLSPVHCILASPLTLTLTHLYYCSNVSHRWRHSRSSDPEQFRGKSKIADSHGEDCHGGADSHGEDCHGGAD
jgi:hypothetical protein